MDWRVRIGLPLLLLLLAAAAVDVGGNNTPPPQPKPPPPRPPPPPKQAPPPPPKGQPPQPQQPPAAEYKSEVVEPYQKLPKPPGPGPKYDSGNTCKYDEPPWSDCDPFHLMRWRNKKLQSGIGCDLYKNETRQCGPDHFPPATRWLIGEHKKCVQELEHLKNMISDLHRWIDLIHERGQAMYRAFGELRKHLEDIQRQIRELHRQNHDNQVLVERLGKELEEWKEKCRKQQVELEELKAKYTRLEKEHIKMKGIYQDMQVANDACKREQRALGKKIGAMLSENRELKGKLMDAERYKELVTKAQQRMSAHQDAIARMRQEIHDTKEGTQHCRIDLMNGKNRKPPTFNKDTHVNLDMQMWVTHNQTREEHDRGMAQPKAKQRDNGYREYKNRQHMMQAAQARNYMQNYGKGQQQQHAGMIAPPPKHLLMHPPPKQQPPPPNNHGKMPPPPKKMMQPPHPPPPPPPQAKKATEKPKPPSTPTPGPQRNVHPPPPPPPMPPPPKKKNPPPPPPPPPPQKHPPPPPPPPPGKMVPPPTHPPQQPHPKAAPAAG